MAKKLLAGATVLLAAVFAAAQSTTPKPRPRASDLGLKVGILPTGPLNAITDVAGVEVGQTTIIRGDNVRTGVTAVLPHTGNLYREKVPAAIFVGNGFGKLTGSTQVDEMGEIETPILLTSTTSVPRAADALISYMLALPGNDDVLSINPVVGETNDGYLSDIRGRHITPDDVFAAVKNAKGGPVEEGAVGAGTGTVVFGWKGGIGTSSRRLPANLGGYTVGVLVQTNFGGVLTIGGAPVGQELGQYYLRKELQQAGTEWNGRQGRRIMHDRRCHRRAAGCAQSETAGGEGVAGHWTHRGLGLQRQRRLRDRILHGTADADPCQDKALTRNAPVMTNDAMSPLFLAVIEATEEAVYNSMFKATTITATDIRSRPCRLKRQWRYSKHTD